MTCMILYFRRQSVQPIQLYARRNVLPRQARVAIYSVPLGCLSYLGHSKEKKTLSDHREELSD